MTYLTNETFFIEIKKFYQQGLFLCIKMLDYDVEQAKDIVNEVVCKIWKNREDFDNETKLKAFFMISIRNSALNVLRHEKVKQNARENISYLSQEQETWVTNIMIYSELMKKLYSFIEELPPQKRKVAKLQLAGYRNYEIADKLNIHINTVKTHKQKILAYLRTKIPYLKEYLIG